MSNNTNNDNYIPLNIKLLILGDSNVGKTVTTLTYTENVFDDTQVPTIGIDLKEKTLILNEYKINLQIWDTAGQERFRSLTKSFYRDVNGIVFMYDITSRESYNNIGIWIRDSKNNVNNIQAIIFGNKKDLESYRKVSTDDLKKIGEKYKMPYLEGSAKTGENIKECFDLLIDELLKHKTKEEIIINFAKDSKTKDRLKRKRIKFKKKC